MSRGAAIGTRKTFGGREYIKTDEGWRYVGKGGGKKAKEHVSKHSKTSTPDPSNNSSKQSSEASKEKKSVEDHAKEASTKDLERFMQSGKDEELKQVAKQELENRKREEGGQEDDSKNSEESSNQDSDQDYSEQESKSLPNIESEQDSETLSEKDGASKLNEKKEGFSVKDTDTLTSTSDEEEVSDINHKFAAFGRFAAGVIKGRMKSLIAYGSGGVGKTFTVTQELQKAGKKIFDPELHDPGDDDYDYVKLTGKMTAAAVYKAMYEHNGKILLFDDCDSVLQDENAINLFKGALDTSGDGTIDWGSAKKIKGFDGEEIPQKFAFNGRAMFISNLDIEGKAGEMLQPIVSRGYGINLSMDRKATMDRIRHIATDHSTGKLTNLKFPGTPSYTHEDMEAVMAYADKHREKAADLNVRTIGTLLAIKKDADEAGVPWEEDAKYVYLRKSEDPDIYNGGLFNNQKKAIEKSIGVDNRSIEEKKIDWCEMKKAFFKDKITSKNYVK